MKVREGDLVKIKNDKRFGPAKVQRVTGTTITTETPLDGFRMWHIDDLEIVKEEEDVTDSTTNPS